MPTATSLINGNLGGGGISSSTSSVDYFSYEKPPGPDKLYRHGQYMPSNRRSWADVVDQCSDGLGSIADDLSSATGTESRHSSQHQHQHPTDGTSGTNPGGGSSRRRSSWEQLIEENEELGDQAKADYAEVTRHETVAPSLPPPLPSVPLPPYANPALHMLTVKEDGRLARVHLYNKKRSNADSSGRTADLCFAKNGTGGGDGGNRRESGSSKTSTMSEFILVPFKTAFTSSTSSICDSTSRFGKVKRSPCSFVLRPPCCPWLHSSRYCLRVSLVMLLSFVLLAASAYGLYALRTYIIGRTTTYELSYPIVAVRPTANVDEELTTAAMTLRLAVDEPSTARFHLTGAFPYQDVRTVFDFDKKLVISRSLSGLSSHCFVSHLNESAFPTIDALREAAENALKKRHPISLPEDWRWQLELVHGTLRDQLYFDSDSKEHCGANLYWLQKTPEQDSMAAAKCVECRAICLPSYGVTRLDRDYGRAVLSPTGRDCVWMPNSWTDGGGGGGIPSAPLSIVNNNVRAPPTFAYNQQSGGGGSSPNQQFARRPPPSRMMVQPSQSGFVPYQQPYPNTFYNPNWPNPPPGVYRNPW